MRMRKRWVCLYRRRAKGETNGNFTRRRAHLRRLSSTIRDWVHHRCTLWQTRWNNSYSVRFLNWELRISIFRVCNLSDHHRHHRGLMKFGAIRANWFFTPSPGEGLSIDQCKQCKRWDELRWTQDIMWQCHVGLDRWYLWSRNMIRFISISTDPPSDRDWFPARTQNRAHW